MMRIPPSALILGLAGLIPFLWGAATLASPALQGWSVRNLGPALTGPFVLQSYGIVILCFMSGTLWGFATRAAGAVAASGYALSTLPALWAFFMAGGNPNTAAVVLLAGFIALLPLDYMFWRQELAPQWWMRLRLILTAVVVVCLGIGVIT